MSTITFFTSHHDPHASPLCQVHGLDDPGDLIDEGDGAGDVVQHGHVTNLRIKETLKPGSRFTNLVILVFD